MLEWPPWKYASHLTDKKPGEETSMQLKLVRGLSVGVKGKYQSSLQPWPKYTDLGFFICVPVLSVGKQSSWKMSLEYWDRSQRVWVVVFWLVRLGFFGGYAVLNTMPALWQPFACYIGTVRFQGMAWLRELLGKQNIKHTGKGSFPKLHRSMLYFMFSWWVNHYPVSPWVT